MTKPDYIIVDDLEDDNAPKVDLNEWINNHFSDKEAFVGTHHLDRVNRILKNGTTHNLHSKK